MDRAEKLIWVRGRLLVFGWLALLGCGWSPGEDVKSDRENSEVHHPVPDLLESNRTEVPTRLTSGEELPSIHLDSSYLPLGQRQIGIESGDPARELGVIVDAALGTNGDVLLLDQSNGQVRVFDSLGIPSQVFGGYGGGPGEFKDPISLGIDPADTLLVADVSAEVHRFVRDGGEWVFLDRIQLDFNPGDLCYGDGRTFLTGQRTAFLEDSLALVSSGSVHEIGLSEDPIRSFGNAYHSDFLLVQRHLEEAAVACDAATDVLWLGFRYLGEVHAFSLDGRPKWVTRFSDFRFPGLLESDGAVRLDSGRNSSSEIEVISNIAFVSPDALFVGVESRPYAGSPEISRKTYVLDSKTGEGRSVLQELAVIGGHSPILVLYQESPFPRVSLVSWGEGR